MNNVTGIIVSYNTPDLLKACYESIRKFYPELKLVIVDGSDRKNPCFRYARTRNMKFNKVISTGYNIGHGPGMKIGINLCQTDYFLLIDSDVTIDKPGVIEAMLTKIEILPFTYGVGQVVSCDDKGANSERGFMYLHPHFSLINKDLYKKFRPFINHGAPCLDAMKDLSTNTQHKVVGFPIHEFITHKERGTRDIKPKAFHPKHWDKI